MPCQVVMRGALVLLAATIAAPGSAPQSQQPPAAVSPPLLFADVATGDYRVALADGSEWLQGAPLAFCDGGRRLATDDGSLVVDRVVNTTSAPPDAFGHPASTTLYLRAAGSNTASHAVSITAYAESPDVAVMTVTYMQAGNSTSCNDDAVLAPPGAVTRTAWPLASNAPAFDTRAARGAALGALTWQGAAAGTTTFGVGLDSVRSNGVDAGPVVTFSLGGARGVHDGRAHAAERKHGAFSDRDGNCTVLVWSTLDQHKTIGQRTGGGRYAAGVVGAIPTVRAGFSYSHLFVRGSRGVTAAVYEWGRCQQAWRSRPELWGTRTWRNPSRILTHVGYYTDNGAALYEWPPRVPDEDRPWPAEQGLALVADALQGALSAPLAYMQLDDWWYEGRFYFGNVVCVGNWTGNRSAGLFPAGVPAFQRRLGLDLMLYTSFWCDDFVDRARYNMTPSTSFNGTVVVDPVDAERFFGDTLDRGLQLANGAFHDYEIDFLGASFEGSAAMFADVDAANTWHAFAFTLYRGMAAAAQARNISIQYCLAYPSDLLVSLDYPSVSNARASGDYCEYALNAPEVGSSSLLMGSLKIAPSKDVFWTTANQPGAAHCDQHNPYWFQPHVEMDVLLAAASMGPVAVGDGLNKTNITLLGKTMAADGTLLRPDRPLSSVDACFDVALDPARPFRNSPYPLDVRATHSNISGVVSHFATAFGLAAPLAVRARDLFPAPDLRSAQFAVYHYPTRATVADGTASRCRNGSAALTPPGAWPRRHDRSSEGGTHGGSGGGGCVEELAQGTLPVFQALRHNVSNATNACGEEMWWYKGAGLLTDCVFEFQMLVPRLPGGWYVLGELDKFVPMSSNRVASIRQAAAPSPASSAVAAADRLEVVLAGPPGEEVVFWVVDAVADVAQAQRAVFPAAAAARTSGAKASPAPPSWSTVTLVFARDRGKD